MADRPKRKRRQATTKAKVSNAHYVGYVEDEESVEAIMKKFEELERIQREFSSLQVNTPTGESSKSESIREDSIEPTNTEDNHIHLDEDETMSEAIMDDASGLTQEQLEEVFKRTSAFTVQSATIDTSQVENMDALELWQVEYRENNTTEFYEEDDYQYLDDFFWEDEFDEKPKRGRLAREPRQPGPRRVDREGIIAKYKIMQVQVQDRNGNLYTIKKRVSDIDPALPTYVRIPPRPLSMSWAHKIRPLTPTIPSIPLGSHYHEVNHVVSTDLTHYGTDFSAVYMDPPFLLPGEAPCPGKITIEEFAQLNVPKVIKAGFLFIWLEKEWLQKLVSIVSKWGFKYVENFCWVKKNLNNEITKTDYKYFKKSKLSLLIFRKEGEIELRHQRNPDCVFDYIRPRLPDEVTEQKPPFMYKVIETLLPNAVYSENNRNGQGLLELWAKKNTRRQGWTSVVETSG